MKKTDDNLGIILMVAGLFFVIFNSIDYVVGWHKVPTMVAAIGIVFMAISVLLSSNKQISGNKQPRK